MLFFFSLSTISALYYQHHHRLETRISKFWEAFPPGCKKWEVNAVAKLNRHISSYKLFSSSSFSIDQHQGSLPPVRFPYEKFAQVDHESNAFIENIETEVDTFDVLYHHKKG
jgi:hypothetical protein